MKYWTLESWGADYPPEDAEEIIALANNRIDAVATAQGETAADVCSEEMWERYCTAGQLTPTGTVINLNGAEIDYESAVNLMDDDLRESLYMEISPCSEQKFFTAYEEAHAEKFGEAWELSKCNPVW